MRRFLVMFSLLLFLASPVFGQVAIEKDGVKIGGAAIRLNFTGDVAISGVGREKTIAIGLINEVVSTTNKTATATDSPRRYIMTATGQNLVTLPTAAAGLTYSVVDGGVAGGVSLDYAILITPQSGDLIEYAPPSTGAPLGTGDRVKSDGITGGSITFVGASGVWYVVDTGSAEWSDAN